MNRWSRSWAIARQSLAVLRSNPSLAAFPVVTGLVSILVTISFAVPSYFLFDLSSSKEQVPPLAYVVMALYYLVSYFVVIFFNAGMVSCTYGALQGRKMDFGDGMRMASRHLGPILGWAAIAATVGMALRLLSERAGFIGKIVVTLLGAAWNIVTYFVVPVLVLENRGPVESIKQSGNILKKTWGEALILNGGTSLALFLLALAPIPIFIVACIATPIGWMFALPAAILYYLALSIIGSSLQGIWNTALYVYAMTGEAPGAFRQEDILAAFTQKPEGKISGYFRR